ncbi:11559_t:CDS:1, partial [Paraglomus brasilianum]
PQNLLIPEDEAIQDEQRPKPMVEQGIPPANPANPPVQDQMEARGRLYLTFEKATSIFVNHQTRIISTSTVFQYSITDRLNGDIGFRNHRPLRKARHKLITPVCIREWQGPLAHLFNVIVTNAMIVGVILGLRKSSNPAADS